MQRQMLTESHAMISMKLAASQKQNNLSSTKIVWLGDGVGIDATDLGLGPFTIRLSNLKYNMGKLAYTLSVLSYAMNSDQANAQVEHSRYYAETEQKMDCYQFYSDTRCGLPLNDTNIAFTIFSKDMNGNFAKNILSNISQGACQLSSVFSYRGFINDTDVDFDCLYYSRYFGNWGFDIDVHVFFNTCANFIKTDIYHCIKNYIEENINNLTPTSSIVTPLPPPDSEDHGVNPLSYLVPIGVSVAAAATFFGYKLYKKYFTVAPQEEDILPMINRNR